MPVVAAYTAYAGGAALFGSATLTTWGAISAGAALVGGSLSLVGTVTGDKNLESDGMMLGTVGSLGMAVSGAPLPGISEGDTASKAASGAAPPAPEVSANATFSPAPDMSIPGANISAAPQNTQFLELSERFKMLEKSNEAAQKANMIGNIGQGVSTAYSSYETRKSNEDMLEKRRIDEQAEIAKREKNMDLTKLTLGVPRNLPRITAPGLINQYNPTTGSGQTTMQIK